MTLAYLINRRGRACVSHKAGGVGWLPRVKTSAGSRHERITRNAAYAFIHGRSRRAIQAGVPAESLRSKTGCFFRGPKRIARWLHSAGVAMVSVAAAGFPKASTVLCFCRQQTRTDYSNHEIRQPLVQAEAHPAQSTRLRGIPSGYTRVHKGPHESPVLTPACRIHEVPRELMECTGSRAVLSYPQLQSPAPCQPSLRGPAWRHLRGSYRAKILRRVVGMGFVRIHGGFSGRRCQKELPLSELPAGASKPEKPAPIIQPRQESAEGRAAGISGQSGRSGPVLADRGNAAGASERVRWRRCWWSRQSGPERSKLRTSRSPSWSSWGSSCGCGCCS